MTQSLALTDFLDIDTLREIQDQFAAVTGVRTTIRDPQGRVITRLRPTEVGSSGPAASPGPVYAAGSIELDGQELGSIVMETAPRSPVPRDRIASLAARFDLSPALVQELVGELEHSCADRNAAAIEFLNVMANAMARLCYQEYQLRQRVEELSTIYRVASELVVRSDLQELLNLVTKTVVEVMHVKAASLRLLDINRRELVPKSVFGLSREYLDKGPVLVEQSIIDRSALRGETIYIADFETDPRVLYPAQMKLEGLISGLVVGMIYRDKPVGVLRLYTSERHDFSSFEVSMVRAIANQAAMAIVNTELRIETRQAELVQQQLEVARNVQRRMIPHQPPRLERLDLAGLYTPCFELGGDFYDFIELPDGRLGVTIADVVGKGVAASLMMASVRSSLRAYAFQYRDIGELLRQVNRAMCRDSLASEFVTLFYCEVDPDTLRMRYCNAGHNPPILLRADGRFEELGVGGTIVGAFDDSRFPVADIRLATGDVLLMYTDGLVDSLNFREERYDVDRVRESLSSFRERPASEILQNIRWSVRKFTGLTPRVDDLTMVAMKINPAAS